MSHIVSRNAAPARVEPSEEEAVDVAASLDLEVQEVVYQASFSTLGRGLPPSLVSFLR